MNSKRGWLVIGVWAFIVGCTQLKESTIPILDATCIVAHQTLPDSEVAQICRITKPFWQPMVDLLTSARNETAQQVAAARTGCGQQDGGK